VTVELVEIADDDELFRRVLPYFIKANNRVSSAAFKKRNKQPDNEISVELGRLSSPVECAQRYGPRGFRVIALTAGSARSLSFEVRHDPLEDCYPHALIVGENDADRCEQLAAASWPVL
jgi:hypothetical protein